MSNVNLDKDPWLAVNLSMFFPGIGQLYGGNLWRGIIFLGGQSWLLSMALWNIFAARGNTVNGLFYLGISVIIYLVNILDSHLGVYLPRTGYISEKIPRKHKNVWFAVFVSRVLPGLGHLYLQKSIIGLGLLTASLLFLKLDDIFTPLLIITPLLTAIATYHTYIVFPRSHSDFQRSLIATMAGFVFFVSLLSNYFPQWLDQRFEQFIIPSESMQPTLQVGDRVFVEKSPDYVPQNGDIVVFTPSEAIKETDPEFADYYIKRVIGIPGDVVSVDNQRVYVNDRPLNEPYIAEPPRYEFSPQFITKNSYLVLGDNRNNSLDSHFWGLLPREVIVGKAYKIGWPPNRIQSLK